MRTVEKAILFCKYKNLPDGHLKTQAQELLPATISFSKKNAVINICQHNPLTEKQRNYLIFFIIKHWSRI